MNQGADAAAFGQHPLRRAARRAPSKNSGVSAAASAAAADTVAHSVAGHRADLTKLNIVSI